MKNWTVEEIKTLRLRLGQSAAEFSRHFGCPIDLIFDWEKGSQSPSPDDVLQFVRLESHLESYCEQVLRDSVADKMLKQMGLEQICQTDLSDLKR
ncbi:MAG: helix-turn-helix transcriptional regulator [Bdellovibrionales bacterium]|nr:helix-turn-helix transcriptional regulator [Bdellovibrionales bacterium]